MNPTSRRAALVLVTVFAVAMAWVEAAVVYDLRVLVDRLEPYQPNPLPMAGALGNIELVREAATLVMLAAVGCLAGATVRARFAYTAVAFGVWDIFYYLCLKVMYGWPRSLFDWDILFLLPLPWWGPVLAPTSIAVLLIVWGTLATASPPVPAGRDRSEAPFWLAAATGAALALYVFMTDALRAAPHGLEAVRAVLPAAFNWPVFLVGLVLMAAPIVPMIAPAVPRLRYHSRVPSITLALGVALIVLGLAGYFLTGTASLTALIPAAFGLVLALAGQLARDERKRKHAMHAAVVVALLGFLGSIRGVLQIGGLFDGTAARPAAIVAQTVMAALTLGYIVIAVRSFVRARLSSRAS